jgi:RimJ/RimL family protein N-acetyltransferase
MEYIRQWRNNQIDILRQTRSITAKEQARYYKIHIQPLFEMATPPQILFSYEHCGELIGYGGLTHVDWESKRAEVSFLLAAEKKYNERSYRIEFAYFLEMLTKVTFEDLNLQRLFTETYDIRPVHIEVLESNGFIQEGRLRRHSIIRDKHVDVLVHGRLKNEA